MRSFNLFAATFLTLSSWAMADDDFSKEVVRATSLTPSLYMLEGAGGNITTLNFEN